MVSSIIMDESTKRCTGCNIDLPLSCFNKHKGRKSGLNSWCKECNKKASADYYENNRESHKNYVKNKSYETGRSKPKQARTFLESFWDRVEKSDNCWIWIGSRTTEENGGYGTIKRDRKNVLAHRISWEMENGRLLSEGEIVRHSCDNPPCINPKHLLVGSHQDNSDDKVSRDRQAQGDTNGRSKLNSDQVLEIVELLIKTDKSLSEISRIYGVDHAVVGKINRRTIWQSVSGPGEPFRLMIKKVRQHGTTTMYNKGKCRCDLCKEAKRAEMEKYRQ